MNQKRYSHSATLLEDGKALVVGGKDGSAVDGTTYLSNAEIYNPSSDSWNIIPDSPIPKRASHSTVGLLNGNVLVIWGMQSGSMSIRYVGLFIPFTSSWIASYVNLNSPEVSTLLLCFPVEKCWWQVEFQDMHTLSIQKYFATPTGTMTVMTAHRDTMIRHALLARIVLSVTCQKV